MTEPHVMLDRELIEAWRSDPSSIGETRAVVESWLERVVAGIGHVPTAAWLANRLALIVAELGYFAGNVAQVEAWRDEQIIDAMEGLFDDTPGGYDDDVRE